MLLGNILLYTDSYNLTHNKMRPEQNQLIDIAYMYNRNEPIRIFGLAGLINRLITSEITTKMIDEAVSIAESNKLEFPKELFMKVVDECGGKLPLKFDMLPEFILLPTGTPFCKITNTKPGFAELVTYWEGYLSHCFFTSGCFTRALDMKHNVTSNIHNFGFRGACCMSESLISGISMLLVFPATDNFITNLMFNNDFIIPHVELAPYLKIFNSIEKPYSIPAASHKVIQSFPNELEAYYYIINQYSGSGQTVAFPIDTYNSYNFVLKHLFNVLSYANSKNVSLSFRIDSGTMLMLATSILDAIISYETSSSCDMNNNESTLQKHKIILSDSMTFSDIEMFKKDIDTYLEKKYGPSFKADDYVYYGWGSNFYNDITRDKYGIVTKLSSYNGTPTMKTTNGKESLLGDIYVKIDENNKVFFVSENKLLSSYVDYTQAVDLEIFKQEVSNTNKKQQEPILIIDNDLKQHVNEFKNRFIL